MELIEKKKSIYYRIDELTIYLSSGVPFDALEFRKRGVTAGVESVEEKMMNVLKVNKEFNEEKEMLYELKYKIRDIEFKAQEVLQQSYKLLNDLFKDVNPSIDLSGSAEYRQLKLRVEKLEDKLKFQIPDNKIIIELETKKKKLELELEEVNNRLSFKDQITKIKARVVELLDEGKNLKAQVAELESQEQLYELYIKTKNEILQDRVNKKFDFIKVKLFCTQVFGGLEECYEIFIDKGEDMKEILEK